MSHQFSKEDLQQLQERSISPEQALQQLDTLKRGIPHVKLDRPCTVGDGITVIDQNEMESLKRNFDDVTARGRVSKFVPASGAASRMFKELITLYEESDELNIKTLISKSNNGELEAGFGLRFFQNLETFAFYEHIKSRMAEEGRNLENVRRSGDLKIILEYLLSPRGLNYSNLPKGIIPFHKKDTIHTPFDEQLVEAVSLQNKNAGGVNLHFTIPIEQNEMVRKQILTSGRDLINARKCQPFEVTFSHQKPSTDTIAAEIDGTAFRDNDGRLLFRPAGHGALLENLNEYDGDIFLVKNIDNVVPEDSLDETITYWKILGGYLVELQKSIFKYLNLLDERQYNQPLIDEILRFSVEKLTLLFPHKFYSSMSLPEQGAYLFSMLNRPIRVCGMMRNTGEPGGGPFWVDDDDNLPSLQIVETSQIDSGDEHQKRILESATHFNPVLLACGVRDYQGAKFNLLDFRDPETGFISIKSYNGRDLKALELPGLWNGSMAYWNTVFVEVPISIFNPVKNVNDLLRDAHQ